MQTVISSWYLCARMWFYSRPINHRCYNSDRRNIVTIELSLLSPSVWMYTHAVSTAAASERMSMSCMFQCFIFMICTVLCRPVPLGCSSRAAMNGNKFYRGRVGVQTLRTQDSSDPRHFGTSAEPSVRHFGTSAKLSGAEVSYGHFLRTLRHQGRHLGTGNSEQNSASLQYHCSYELAGETRTM